MGWTRFFFISKVVPSNNFVAILPYENSSKIKKNFAKIIDKIACSLHQYRLVFDSKMKCYLAALSKSNIQLQKVSTKIESTAKKTS